MRTPHIFDGHSGSVRGAGDCSGPKSKGNLFYGKQWTYTDIFNVLKNPKYVGCNVRHRTTQRLRSKTRPVSEDKWITRPGAFAPIVDQQIFDLAHANFPMKSRHSEIVGIPTIRGCLSSLTHKRVTSKHFARALFADASPFLRPNPSVIRVRVPAHLGPLGLGVLRYVCGDNRSGAVPPLP